MNALASFALVAMTSVCLAAAPAHAQVGVQFEQTSSPPRVDGALREWRGTRFINVGAGDDASLSFAFRYDGAGFYLGARVRDDRVVRSRRPGTADDAVVVTFAMPTGDAGGRLRASELWLYPGVSGIPAAAAVGALGARPRAVRGARVVEGPLEGGRGYELEAFVPWRAIPGSAEWQSGHVSIRLRDIDQEARPTVESEPALVAVDPSALDRLPRIEATGGEAAMLRTFLRSRDLDAARPRFDERGNVAGDARPERVLVVDRFVVVMGEGYRDGQAFDFFELPVVGAAGVRGAELVDVTGDAHRELAVRLRQQNDLGSRDLWQVFRFSNNRIEPLFGVELRKETERGFVEARLDVRRSRRGPPAIQVSAGRAEGLDAQTFREAPAAGVAPMLLPWGPIARRVYRWSGSSFAVVSEDPNPRHRAAAPARSTERSSTQSPARRTTRPAERAGSRYDAAALLAAFRERAGVAAAARPRFRVRANLAEGREREELLVFGKTLVVTGPGFRRGGSWFQFEVPVESAGDLLEVSSADLTGDGREEVLLRVRRSAGDVTREILLVQQFTPDSFRRILAVEVARSQGTARVENQVQLLRSGELVVAPGRARGWDAASWPFTDGTGDGVDPILLPWRDDTERYQYRPGQLHRD